MEQDIVRASVERSWTDEVLPSLAGLVTIPALSPAFDAQWPEHGQLRAAVDHVQAWIGTRGLPGATSEVIELPGRSPLLLVDVPATAGAAGADPGSRGTVLLYGHLDKQPPVGGWADGLGPWTPVFRDGKLFGRGAADDGYAAYAATTALEAVRAAGGEHARAVLLLETGEESGSPDLPAYVEHLAGRLGDVTFVVCLDGGGGDYERMWLMSSLRGLVKLTVTVKVLETAQHSGMASGIVPSSFRILRQLLDRVEDAATGEIKLPEFNAPIPADRRAAAKATAALDPDGPKRLYPLLDGMRPVSEDDVELILNNTWRPTLSVTGAAGLPEPAQAGNVLRACHGADAELPHLAAGRRESGRRCPGAGADHRRALRRHRRDQRLRGRERLERARVRALADRGDGVGQRPGVREGVRQPGHRRLDPVHGDAGPAYPQAQIVVTGALGADSNAHVPNEWLDIPFAQQITEAVAHLLDAHARS